ncbi:LysM peptidoglycan-binding domain-containing protein [Nesterenkonia muleiensis]|uniref:LysM peptidoglycan-binding domain-containing protein n=1 Tax=Nesterenkonia muleiensis TaxID=2282648 RepID=UPI000E720398|nr:LysM peptidoglycan-binding domain-containing protein [Nesterenkonia muleiensis]
MTATANTAATNTGLNAPGLRLTRRGRLLLLGLPAVLAAVALLAAAVFAAAALFNQALASTGAASGVEAEQVTVTEGDTLWSIASAAESDADIQQLITQIAELNDLDSAQLEHGQVLFVPAD